MIPAEDRCNSMPCKNGGTCINDYHGRYTCKCADDWRGEHCTEYGDIIAILIGSCS